MDLFFEFRRDSRISGAREVARRGEQKAEDALDAVKDLEQRVDRLALLNMALWSLLREKTGLTDEDLTRRVAELDAADGQPDGRRTPTVEECPECGRTLSLKHRKCLFCGHAPAETDPFDRVSR